MADENKSAIGFTTGVTIRDAARDLGTSKKTAERKFEYIAKLCERAHEIDWR